jgi:hypothetical protein
MNMNFFRKKKNKRHVRKTGADKLAVDIIKNKGNSNPTVEAAVLSKHFGIPISPEALKPESPVEQFRRKVFNLANQSIDGNEESKERAIDAAFSELENSSQISGRKKVPYWRRDPGRGADIDDSFMGPYPPSDSLEETLNNIELLEHRFARQQPGLIQAMLQPGGIGTELLKLFNSMMAAGGSNQLLPTNPKIAAPVVPNMISVEVNGSLVEMTKEGYDIYKKQHEELLSLKNKETEKVPGINEPKSMESKNTDNNLPAQPQSKDSEPGNQGHKIEIPPGLKDYIEKNIDVFKEIGETLLRAMSVTPEDFVEVLEEDEQNGDLTTIAVLQYIRTHNIEEVYGSLQLLESFQPLNPYIQKLKENPKWLEEVIADLKQ